MEALIGPTLTNGSSSVATSEATSNLEVVGLYFSASWCGPCRSFTPNLVQAVNKLKSEGKGMQVVFVSSDQDEASFKEYYSHMEGFLALPFANRDLKSKLSSKYKVRGIPTLVLVNAKTGELISTDGRSLISSDLSSFPWKPVPLSEVLAPLTFKGHSSSASFQSLCEKGSYLGLYFSAHWCPPCRGFTPVLSESYKAVKAKNPDGFEIAFVSSDRDEEQFKEYFESMPWMALPFELRKEKEVLSKAFSVSGIPTFVLLKCEPGGSVTVVNADARSSVGSEKSPGEGFPWLPKLVNGLEEVNETIEELPSLVAFVEEAGDKWESTEQAMIAVASKQTAGEFGFWVATETGGVSDQIRKLCGLGRAKSGTSSLVLLNLPESGSYYVSPAEEITQQAVQDVVDAYKAGTIAWKTISK